MEITMKTSLLNLLPYSNPPLPTPPDHRMENCELTQERRKSLSYYDISIFFDFVTS